MAGTWDNEDRVMMAAVMHDNEASAEDYGDRVVTSFSSEKDLINTYQP